MITATASLLVAGQPAFAAQLSAEDQYVDTGPTGNVTGGATEPSDGSGAAEPGVGTPTAPGTPVIGGPSGSDPGSIRVDGKGEGNRAVANATGRGNSGGFELPLFGYPLTPLAGLVLGLLAAALAVRIFTKLSESRLGQET